MIESLKNPLYRWSKARKNELMQAGLEKGWECLFLMSVIDRSIIRANDVIH